MTDPAGRRWVSWSRHDGSAGAYSRRPARVGGRVTTTRSASSTCPGPPSAAAVSDPDAVVVVVDAPHRRRQADPVAQPVGHGPGDLDGAAHDAVLLGAALHRQQRLEVRAGVGVEEGVEGGEVGGLGGEHRLGGDAEVGPAQGCAQVACGSRSRRSGRRGRRTRSPCQGRSRSMRAAARSKRAMPCGQVGQHERVEPGHGAPLGAHAAGPSTQLHHVLAGVPGGERLQAQLARPGAYIRFWVGPIHWPPSSTGVPSPGDAALGPPADAVAGLDHDDVRAGGDQAPGRGQPGQSGTDDHDPAHRPAPAGSGDNPAARSCPAQ